MKPKKICTDGYQSIDRVVKPLGNSGHVQVPKAWIGKKVSIVLLEGLE